MLKLKHDLAALTAMTLLQCKVVTSCTTSLSADYHMGKSMVREVDTVWVRVLGDTRVALDEHESKRLVDSL